MFVHWRSHPRRDVIRHMRFTHDTELLIVHWRGQETRQLRSLNQDVIRMEIADHSLVAVVCDGVSSSLHGHLAATWLADALVAYLGESSNVRQPDQLSDSLHLYLNDLATRSHPAVVREVAREKLGELPLVNIVRRETLQSQGSASMFFAVRIDRSLTDPSMASLYCLWLGNTIACCYSRHAVISSFGDVRDEHPRWSTARGISGTIQVAHLLDVPLKRLWIATDGAANLPPHRQFGDDALRTYLQGVHDDCSILDIHWGRK